MRPLAIVTGASSGIGEVFSRRLAESGCDLVLVARRIERLRNIAAELISRYGISAECLEADLTVEEECKRVEDRIASAPNLEYLVNNAGFGTLGRFFEIPVESQDRMHRLHVLAPMRLMHAALAGMVPRNSGNIINVSSVAGFAQSAGSASYCATKTWMNHFTENIFIELKTVGSQVRVQALCPGYTLSEFHDVAQMDRSGIPKALWLQADFVVDESLRGLKKNELFVIPGRKYQAGVAILNFLPRPFRQRLAIRTGEFRKPRHPGNLPTPSA